MLWIYYAFLKGDDVLLVTINSVGCFIETAYIAMFIAYAPRRARVRRNNSIFLFKKIVAFSNRVGKNIESAQPNLDRPDPNIPHAIYKSATQVMQ